MVQMAAHLPPDASQDEIDEHWLAHVYKPDEPQLTVRAAVAGMFLGGVMSIANIYVGMKIGWSVGMALTSVILAFMMFWGLRSIRLVRADFTKLENNTVASAASAAGYFSSAGMVSAIPALYLTQNRFLAWWELAIWVLGVSFVGVLMAVPMRRQMIDVDRLPFPSGIACAETIRSMHEKATEALARGRSLLVGFAVAALFEIPYAVGRFAGIANPITWPEKLRVPGTAAGYPLAAFNVTLNSSLLFYGLGAILGPRVGLSLAAGAIVAWGFLGPWLATHGVVVPGEGIVVHRSLTNWSVWPGVLMFVVSSLLAFALKWRTIVSAFGTLGKIFRSDVKASKMAAVEVPGSWFGWGMLAATVYVAVAAKLLFDMPIWMGVIAVALAFLLSIVACRSAGETDIPPVGPLGKIAQLLYAGIAPANPQINLMAACVTAGAATHSSDLLTDLKTGYLLGGSPRKQFIAQFLGILAGGLFCIPAYLLLIQPESIATARWPAPAAQQWAAVAELLASGVSYEDRGPGEAVPARVQAIQINQRLPGIAVGDELRIASGPSAGSYRIMMIDRNVLVVDGTLTAGPRGDLYDAEIVAASGASRGKTGVYPSVLDRPGLRFIARPEGARAGDYALAHVDGREVYHRMTGLAGDVAMLDHDFVDSAMPVPVLVKKMGLPPYALEATLITVLAGIFITLLEVFGPRRWRPYLPSVMGFGIAWVVSFGDSVAAAVGAIVAWAVARAWPKLAERYTVSTSSGIIAGASIMALVIIALSLAGVIESP
jgi:OPT family oligopeptide transporter